MTKSESKPKAVPELVRGHIEPATAEGFQALLLNANRFLSHPDHSGYELLTVIRLEKTVASIFVRRNLKRKTITEFFEEDDVQV